MSWTAFFLIVLSAGFHASWNLIAKKTGMSVAFYATICSVSAVLWFPTFFWSPLAVTSLPWTFWMYLVCSICCDALLYCMGLLWCYKHMEMSTAYPMMRALPIILTALVTAMLGWGKPLTLMNGIGFLIVFTGALMMPLARFSDFHLSNYCNRNSLAILLVACGTTGYTVFDSRCQKVLSECAGQFSSAIRSVTYYSARELCLSLLLWAIVVYFPANRRACRSVWIEHKPTPMLFAGVFGSLAYVLVLFSMNFVTNVSFVQVFRQLGLPIGVALSVLILKEHCPPTKRLGVTLILTGLLIAIL